MNQLTQNTKTTLNSSHQTRSISYHSDPKHRLGTEGSKATTDFPAITSNNGGFCIKCQDKISYLENTIKLNGKEKENLEYMITFKEMGIKKRDEMLEQYAEENSKLKESVKKMEKYVERLKFELNSSGRVLLDGPPDSQQNSSRPATTTNVSAKKVHFPVSNNHGGHPKTLLIKSSSTIIKLAKLRSKTVTETQGLPENQSLFADRQGKFSLFNEEEDKRITKNPKFKQLEEFLKKNEDYVDALTKMTKSYQREIFENFATIMGDFKNIMNLTLRMKKLVKSSQLMSTSLVLDEALNCIVKETCENLNCDRATVFLVDENTNELWSRVAKDAKTIRIPINAGVVGYVATNNVNVKIDDAYQDPRFNKEVDKKNNYKTTTILCVPIKDSSEKVIGVLQAINKLDGTFTADDESILCLLSNQAGLMLRNSLMYDKLVFNQFKLMKLIDIGMNLFEIIDIDLVLLHAEKRLKDIMNTDKCQIFYVDHDNRKLVHFEVDRGNRVSPMDIGIVGESVRTGLIIECIEPNSHHFYNMLVDIDTNLPLATIPVKAKDEHVLAVYQVVHTKSISNKNQKLSSVFDNDIFGFFTKILQICLEKSSKVQKMIEDRAKSFKSNSFYKAPRRTTVVDSTNTLSGRLSE